MKKILLGILITTVVAVLTVGLALAAKPNTTLIPATNDRANVPVIIPAHAVEVADGVFSLGTARDVDGRIVEGFLFIDNRRGNAKPPWAGGGKNGDKGGNSKCYEFLAKGARWKTVEKYLTGSGIDPTLTETSLNAWDTVVSFDVFGIRDTTGTTDGADTESPDGKNEVEFASLGATNTIAYTIVWGIFYGPPRQRELVEWDVVFNSDYAWSLSGEAGKMDYQNIATHEFGHALGLGHPEDTCAEETMYRYAEFGETKKRTLEAGDVKGIQELYK